MDLNRMNQSWLCSTCGFQISFKNIHHWKRSKRVRDLTNLVEGGFVLEFTSWLLSLGLRKGSLRQMPHPTLGARGECWKPHRCRGPIPKDSDTAGLGRGLGIGSFKSSQVLLIWFSTFIMHGITSRALSKLDNWVPPLSCWFNRFGIGANNLQF